VIEAPTSLFKVSFIGNERHIRIKIETEAIERDRTGEQIANLKGQIQNFTTGGCRSVEVIRWEPDARPRLGVAYKAVASLILSHFRPPLSKLT
jgi:hypothetical protein